MPTISSGRVSLTPVRAETSATLDDIASQLAKSPPSAQSLQPGWSAFDPSDTGIGFFGATPANVAKPQVIPATQQFPERLIARYFHWVHDSVREKVLELAGTTPTQLETSRLEAVDIVVSKEAGGSGYLVLVSTRNEDDLNAALRSAEAATKAIDPSSDWKPTNRSSLYNGGTDFFLWLVERKIEKPTVDSALTLIAISGLESRDNRLRQNVLKDEIDGDRPNFLTAVADGHELGPIRFSMRLPLVPARITLSLWADGSLVLLTSGTHYSSRANVQNESVQAVQDLAYVYLPRLKQFFDADSDWSTRRRVEFRRRARSKLEQRYAVPSP